MGFGSVDPSQLEGEDLADWYRRSPAEIEQARRAAAQQQYNSFFGRTGTSGADGNGGNEPYPAVDGPEPSVATSIYTPLQEREPASGLGIRDVTGTPRGLALLNLRSMDANGAQHPELVLAANRVAPNSLKARQQSASSTSRPGGRAPQSVHPPPLPVGVPPLPTFFSALFGGPVPLHGANGVVIGNYDHQAVRAGLQITAKYAAIAPLFEPGAWADGVFSDPAPVTKAITNGISEAVDGTASHAAGEALSGASDAAAQEPIHSHHVWAKFMGGPEDQEREEMLRSLHIKFHSRLMQALKEAGGFPNVGGVKGSTDIWKEHFVGNPGEFERAIDILRKVSQDFDREHGTGIALKLERALAKLGH